MAMRTAEDVANMESEINDMRALVDDLNTRLTQADTERKILKIENALLQRKADENLAKATRIESIMTQTAAGLMSGLKEMREEREVARALRRERQEQDLGVGTDRPAFVDDEKPPGAAFKEGQRQHDRDLHLKLRVHPALRPAEPREGVMVSADEMIAPPQAPSFLQRPRAGRVDTSIAAHDSRMPHNEFPGGPRDLDEENLRKIANDMGTHAQG